MTPSIQCSLCEHEALSLVFSTTLKNEKNGSCNHSSGEVDTGGFLVVTAQKDWPYGWASNQHLYPVEQNSTLSLASTCVQTLMQAHSHSYVQKHTYRCIYTCMPPHEYIYTYIQNKNKIIYDYEGTSSGHRVASLASRNNSGNDTNSNHSDGITINSWLFAHTKLF